MQYAEDGDLSKFSAAEISAGAEWTGDADLFASALRETGWMDGDGTLHDWWEYAGKLVARREKNREAMRAARGTKPKPTCAPRVEHVETTCRATNQPTNQTNQPTRVDTRVDGDTPPEEESKPEPYMVLANEVSEWLGSGIAHSPAGHKSLIDLLAECSGDMEAARGCLKIAKQGAKSLRGALAYAVTVAANKRAENAKAGSKPKVRMPVNVDLGGWRMSNLLDPSVIASQFDRLPPHDIEAEMCVLASMMLAGDNGALFAETVQGLTPEAFFQTDHQVIYRAIIEARRSGPVDPVLLRGHLDRAKLLEEIGGTAYLGQIVNKVPSAAHGPHYARIVREKHVIRQGIAVCNDYMRWAYGPQDEGAASVRLTATAGELVKAASDHQINYDTSSQLSEKCITEAFGEIDTRSFATGFADFPYVRPGRTYIVAGNPSMGKSMWSKFLLLGLAQRGYAVGMITPDETRTKVGQDFIAMLGSVDRDAIEKRRLNAEQQGKYLEAVGKFAELPIYIEDDCYSIEEVEALGTLWKAKHNIQVLYVDYVGLLSTADKEARGSTTARVTVVAKALKRLFRRLDVAGVVVSQLSRANTHREDKRPLMSDLRESGELEAAADCILGLHREAYYQHDKGGEQKGPDYSEVWVLKDKTGARMRAFVMKSDFATMRYLPLHPDAQRQYWRDMNKGNE